MSRPDSPDARLGWGWFVALSLIRSLAFAIPVALLLPRRDRGDRFTPGE